MHPAHLTTAAAAGIGTILATATIHMLAPAAEALSSPCLPAAWRDAYGPWAFLFATAAMMGMHLVDYLVKVGLRVTGGIKMGPRVGGGGEVRWGSGWRGKSGGAPLSMGGKLESCARACSARVV